MNLEDRADRDRAETVACPLCHAAAGITCRNLSSGEPLAQLPAHILRMHAAGIVHAPLDTRELRAAHERTPQ